MSRLNSIKKKTSPCFVVLIGNRLDDKRLYFSLYFNSGSPKCQIAGQAQAQIPGWSSKSRGASPDGKIYLFGPVV